MAFTLLVCSDISGHKLNLELPFKDKPQLPNLHASIESVFEFETQQRRRNNSPPSRNNGPIPSSPAEQGGGGGRTFALGRVQIYSDEIRQWVDLVSSSQIHPYDQLYAYQRHSDDTDGAGSGRELPPPVSSGYFTSPRGGVDNSPSASSSSYRNNNNTSRTTAVVDAADLGETVRTYRTNSASPTPGSSRANHNNAQPSSSNGGVIQVISAPAEAFHMSTEEKMRLIFQDADVEGNGYLSLADFREVFTRTHIQFNRATIDEIFRFQGSNPSYLNYNEFTNFCRQYPVT
jgi:hypothetical protein